MSRSRRDEPVAAGGSEAFRIATVYSALFFLFGIHLPYWPVWLGSRGATPSEVGFLLGVALWARAIVNPTIGRIADASRRPAVIARALALASLVAYAAFWFAHDFATLLVLAIVLGVSIAPLTPLVDGLAVVSAAAGRVDYGLVRRWGSLAFVVASLVGGLWLEGRGDDTILWVLVAAAGVLALSSMLLPSERPAPTTPSESTIRSLLRRPGFVLMLAAAGALQSSHAVLYGFGTKDWRARGLDDAVIGGLWAEGVVAEIILFSFGRRVLTRVPPAGLLAIAGLGGLVRWPITAATASLPVLAIVQLLHAATFGALHLGAMSWIREHVPDSAVLRATTLYTAAAAGVALGLGLVSAGLLYESQHSAAYHYMTIGSGTGMLLALVLLRRHRT